MRNRTSTILKLMSFTVVVVICVGIWFLISPGQSPLNLNFKSPLLRKQDNSLGAQVETIIQSQNTDIFSGDSIKVALRIFDIQENYLHSKLNNRKVQFNIEGTGRPIPLTYYPSEKEYRGHGKVKFLFPNNYAISIVYGSEDSISPGTILATFPYSIHVLPYYEKSAMNLNMTIYRLTKIILILTVVILWTGFIMIFR